MTDVLVAFTLVKQQKLMASRLNRTRIQASENGLLLHRTRTHKSCANWVESAARG